MYTVLGSLEEKSGYKYVTNKEICKYIKKPREEKGFSEGLKEGAPPRPPYVGNVLFAARGGGTRSQQAYINRPQSTRSLRVVGPYERAAVSLLVKSRGPLDRALAAQGAVPLSLSPPPQRKRWRRKRPLSSRRRRRFCRPRLLGKSEEARCCGWGKQPLCCGRSPPSASLPSGPGHLAASPEEPRPEGRTRRSSYASMERRTATTQTSSLHDARLLQEGIAEIQMNRPHARNSLGEKLVDELYETLDVLRFDESVRVVIVKSNVEGVFCAGADLKERAQMTDPEADHFVQRLRSLMDGIAALPMPTIAAIDGYALGGGLELALACDLRVAASSAKMGLIETTRGLFPGAGGTQRLPRCIGIGLAKELIFTGRQIDGQEAFSIGLVNHTVPQNEEGDAAYERALALAEEIVPRAPIAVKMGKVAINRGIEVDIASGMAIERMCYAQNIPTRDRQEGMAAFIEKRPPKFIGK